MYIILIQYKKSDAQVNQYKTAHKIFLEEQVKQGNFITSGVRTPNTGEVVLSCLDDIESIHTVLNNDPFYKKRIGHYEIIEFIPEMSCSQFEEFIPGK